MKFIRKNKLILAILCCGFIFLAGFNNSVYASSKTNESAQKKCLFPVNNGGWTIVTIKGKLKVNYNSPSTAANAYTSREKSYIAEVSATTTNPSIKFLYVKDYNSSGTVVKTFNSWSNLQLIYGSPWNRAQGYKNTEKRIYNKTKGYYEKMSIQIDCANSSAAPFYVNCRINLK